MAQTQPPHCSCCAGEHVYVLLQGSFGFVDAIFGSQKRKTGGTKVWK
jgi:hypothetical protein